MNVLVSLALLVGGILVFGAALIVPTRGRHVLSAANGSDVSAGRSHRTSDVRGSGKQRSSPLASPELRSEDASRTPSATFHDLRFATASVETDSAARVRAEIGVPSTSIGFGAVETARLVRERRISWSEGLASGNDALDRIGLPPLLPMPIADDGGDDFVMQAEAGHRSAIERWDTAESHGAVSPSVARARDDVEAASDGDAPVLEHVVAWEGVDPCSPPIPTESPSILAFADATSRSRRDASRRVARLRSPERWLASLQGADLGEASEAAYELRLRFGGTTLEEILALAVPPQRAAHILAILPPEIPIASYS